MNQQTWWIEIKNCKCCGWDKFGTAEYPTREAALAHCYKIYCDYGDELRVVSSAGEAQGLVFS